MKYHRLLGLVLLYQLGTRARSYIDARLYEDLAFRQTSRGRRLSTVGISWKATGKRVSPWLVDEQVDRNKTSQYG